VLTNRRLLSKESWRYTKKEIASVRERFQVFCMDAVEYKKVWKQDPVFITPSLKKGITKTLTHLPAIIDNLWETYPTVNLKVSKIFFC